jgi:hypothetical protein
VAASQLLPSKISAQARAAFDAAEKKVVEAQAL